MQKLAAKARSIAFSTWACPDPMRSASTNPLTLLETSAVFNRVSGPVIGAGDRLADIAGINWFNR